MVARAGERSDPPVPAPRSLRPVLGFSRLPPRALDLIRRALDEDDEFRDRVAGLAGEDDVGRPSWLFLARPEGWDVQLAVLASQAEEADAAVRDEHAERSARRRLEHAEAAARRAEERLDEARSSVLRTEQELDLAVRARREAEAEAAALRRRVESLEGERDAARRRAREVEADAGRWKAEAARLQAEVRGLETEVAWLKGEVGRLAGEVGRLEDDPRRHGRRDDANRETVRRGGLPARSTDGRDGGEPQPSRPDLDVIAAALDDAARAGSALSEALDSAARELRAGGRPVEGAPGHPPGGERSAHEGGPHPSPQHRPDARTSSPAPSPRPPRPGRVPVPLPPGILDDSVEAAAHLVRARGVVVFVDGYNASLRAWPELPIAEQRCRLADALNELVARAGASVHVVFDGAGGVEPLPLDRRSRVRVRFSPPDVEADDLILQLVDEMPSGSPVLVVTGDRRVQQEARRRGANVIGVDQLFALLRRER